VTGAVKTKAVTDNQTQRNYGNGKEALNLCVGNPTFNFGKEKNAFFLQWTGISS